MTRQIVGGYGVSVSERSSPAPCVSRLAAGAAGQRRAARGEVMKKKTGGGLVNI